VLTAQHSIVLRKLTK